MWGSNTQRAMSAVVFSVLVLVLAAPVLANDSQPEPATQCPDKSQPVQCLVDPCRFKNCTEGFECIANYCGSCNATCKPLPEPTYPIPAGTKCADGKKPPVCRHLPCAVVRCRSGYECVNDYCNCTASCDPVKPETVIQTGGGASTTTNAPELSPPKEQVRPGCNIVNCLVAPCIVSTCPTNTRCIDDYCNGCNAICQPLDQPGPPPTTPAPAPVPMPNTPTSDKVCVVTAKVDSEQSRVALSGSVNSPVKASLTNARRISTLEGSVYIIFPAFKKACPTAAQLPRALQTAYVANPKSAPGLTTSPITLRATIANGKVALDGLKLAVQGTVKPKGLALSLRAVATSGSVSFDAPGVSAAPIKLKGKAFTDSGCSLAAAKGSVSVLCPELSLSSTITDSARNLNVTLVLAGKLAAVGDVAAAGKLLPVTSVPAKGLAHQAACFTDTGTVPGGSVALLCWHAGDR